MILRITTTIIEMNKKFLFLKPQHNCESQIDYNANKICQLCEKNVAFFGKELFFVPDHFSFLFLMEFILIIH